MILSRKLLLRKGRTGLADMLTSGHSVYAGEQEEVGLYSLRPPVHLSASINGTLYIRNFWSLVTIVHASTCAAAMINRSNGSL